MISTKRTIAVAACLVALAYMAGCENDNDPVAPPNSTITVSANPQTVVVPASGVGTSEITATLRSSNGNRLPNQEVTFSTSAGSLTPPAETPLKTDSMGQARSTLSTSSSATVTARSGSINAQTQIQTAPGNLAQFLLNVQPTELTTCNDMLVLTASVRTTTGDPVQGVIVIFEEVTPPSTVTGNFAPGSQVLSDANGDARVTWTPTSTSCSQKCQFATGDPNSPTRGSCSLTFAATDTTDTFRSAEVQVNDNIP